MSNSSFELSDELFESQNMMTIATFIFECVLSLFSSTAEVLDHSVTPCSNPKDFVPFTKDRTYALYIRMDNKFDFTTWNNVARCMKIWDLDARGFHNSLWRMWFNGNHILIVGYPASPYSTHKPSNIEPVYMSKKETRPPD